MNAPQTRHHMEIVRRSVVMWLNYLARQRVHTLPPNMMSEELRAERLELLRLYHGKFDHISMIELPAHDMLELHVILHRIHSFLKRYGEGLGVDIIRQYQLQSVMAGRFND